MMNFLSFVSQFGDEWRGRLLVAWNLEFPKKRQRDAENETVGSIIVSN